jgi:NO-binding membrane sensor protein with MHYT domain
MPTEYPVLVVFHDHRLVVLSVFISMFAAYASRDLSDRVRDARGRIWLLWLAGGTVVDGIGTWSMHYNGMMAFHLQIPVQFDWRADLLSLLAGIHGS